MTRHIPPEVKTAVTERATLTDKLLVAPLIEAVNEQNDIHDDLGNISRHWRNSGTSVSNCKE